MQARDFAALLLSLFAIYLALQNDGEVTFVRSWYYPLEEPTFHLADKSSPLPRPVVADLNGDGQPEVIIATEDNMVKVISARPSIRVPDGFSRARVLANVTIKDEFGDPNDPVPRNMRAVALAAGFIDPVPTELVRARRKQVVVVLTAGRELLCLDHNLNIMWRQKHIMGWFPDSFRFREVAIHISNHSMREGDRGVVIVAASVTQGDAEEKEMEELERELEEGDGPHKEKKEDKEGKEGKDAEEKEEEYNNYWNVDALRHVNYYAFDGATGYYRWSHVGSDLRHTAEEDKQQLVPQHNYRLEAATMASAHTGETDCRDYKESVLYTSLPHLWRSRKDTSLELAYFVRHRESSGRDTGHIARASRQTGVLQGGAKDANRHNFAGRDRKNVVTRTLGAVAGKAAGGSFVDTPSRQHSAAAPASSSPPPNVIVAHLREGIEVIHLYTGRPLCRLTLQAGLLHGDLNGDGVVDHIRTRGGSPQAGGHRPHRGGHAPAGGCYAVATSGIGRQEPLFNGSLCRERLGIGGASLESIFGSKLPSLSKKGAPTLEIAPPLMVPLFGHPRKPRVGALDRTHGRAWLSVFLNSRGEVVAYDPHGNVAWSEETESGWINLKKFKASDRIAPTLALFPLRTRTAHRLILASGSHTATLLTVSGEIVAEVEMPAPPARPLQFADLSGNGLTDLLLTSHEGLYGFNQVHHVGAGPLQALVACLVVAVGATYLTAVAGGSSGRRKMRSTDRTD